MKAYVLSEVFGTVQIGGTIFQPCTGAKFRANRKGLKGLRSIEVRKASMAEAEKALKK